MENKLTNQEIARVFAMYLGCNTKYRKGVYAHNDWGIGCFIEDNEVEYKMCFRKNSFSLYDRLLLLTPLEKISDEHAVEVAKIAARRPSVYSINEADIRRNENSIDVVFVDKIYETVNIAFNGDVLVYITEDNLKNKIEQRSYGQSHYIDLLRELGYALPYKGIDLFEAGIAVDKTNTF